MGHAYSYPTHLVLLLDFLLVILFGLLLLTRAPPATGATARVEKLCRRLGRHPTRALLLIGLLGGLGNFLFLAVQGPPIPNATDELSYVLAADTFASGHLARPTHPMWRHFGAHVLHWPAYASKYPPAQGLLLALGQVLGGSPAFGLCLASALLCAATYWMFMAWLRPGWAVFGAILVLLHLGVGSYWNHSYWGGSVAAIGGALVFGALRRLIERPNVMLSVVLATGLVILANSRPYEGLLLSLPAAWVLLRRVWTARRRQLYLTRVVTPICVALALAAGAMAHYNQRITGDPWLLPHLGYTHAYNFAPEFLFQPGTGQAFSWQMRAPAWPSGPERQASEGQASERQASERQASEAKQAWLLPALRATGHRLSRSSYFVLGAALVLPLFCFLPSARNRTLAAACLLVILGNGLTRFWFPHYSAPIVAPLYVLALTNLRRLRVWRWHNRRVARPTVAIVLSINLVLFLVLLPAYRADDYEWHMRRARIQERLEALPGNHLVMMLDPMDWLHNASDIDASRVVWARDLGHEGNRALLEYFHDRRVWRVDRDEFLVTPFEKPAVH